MPECPSVFAWGDSRSLCLFCPLRPPPNIKALVRRVPTFPRPPAPQSEFDWTAAQLSTDSPSLSAELAHDLLWHRGLRSKRHPHPPFFFFCSSCPICPRKKLPEPRRRHAAKTGTTTTTMASVPVCSECAVWGASAGTLWHAVVVVVGIVAAWWN